MLRSTAAPPSTPPGLVLPNLASEEEGYIRLELSRRKKEEYRDGTGYAEDDEYDSRDR